MKKTLCFLALSWMITAHAGGNIEAGKVKSATCAACHGNEGVSINPEWPSLAGQNRHYLEKQLREYKSGVRVSPIMAPLVAGLSEEDMQDLSAYYAQFSLPNGKTPEQYLSKGQLLYRGGDFSQKITACIACHGPNGNGNNQAGFPALSGQQVPYTVAQLQLFKDKKRNNDLNAIMRDISARMSKEDMEAVAHYCSGLH